MGKGSKQRPRQVSKSQFDANFDLIFGKGKANADSDKRQYEGSSEESGLQVPTSDTIRSIESIE
jgi:hypothetical protein